MILKPYIMMIVIGLLGACAMQTEQTESHKTPVPALLLSYSNSDFTNPHDVVLPNEATDNTGIFTHMGAKYSGFETKRHTATKANASDNLLHYNHNARQWLTIGLKERTKIDKIHISTKYFTGNQVRAVSVYLKDELTGKQQQVLNRTPLKPDSNHIFKIPDIMATEARIDAYYEGGISRIHFFGEKTPEQLPMRKNLLEDTVISHISNTHYGKPDKAVRGNRVEDYMIGWESARTGFGEQAVFHLIKPTIIEEIVVDTYLHRLNAPLTSHIYGVSLGANESLDDVMKLAPRWKIVFADGKQIIPENFQNYMLEQAYLKEQGGDNTTFNIMLDVPPQSPWKPIVPFVALRPDTYHRLKNIGDKNPITHLLYMHYPNGGIHGLKVFGKEE